MTLNVRTGLLIWAVLHLMLRTGISQTDCQLRKSQDEIFVYTCKVEDSKLKSIRTTFTLPTTPSKLAGYLLDTDTYTQWQYNIVKTEVLNRISGSEIIYWAELDAPWPVTNRDLVLHLKLTQDPVSKVMRFSVLSVPDYIPPKDGLIRVPLSEANWIITPVDKQKLSIQHSFLIDPGGSIPAWLMNMSVAEGPYRTFLNLTDHVKSGKPVTPLQGILD